MVNSTGVEADDIVVLRLATSCIRIMRRFGEVDSVLELQILDSALCELQIPLGHLRKVSLRLYRLVVERA
jgi:hypothetical protein